MLKTVNHEVNGLQQQKTSGSTPAKSQKQESRATRNRVTQTDQLEINKLLPGLKFLSLGESVLTIASDPCSWLTGVDLMFSPVLATSIAKFYVSSVLLISF